jgi:DNA-binding CsgD family transcriptional regulator
MAALSPFIGRQQELARLEACYADATGGRGGVVLVSGELGVGKTRLIEEFAQGAQAMGALVAYGRWYESEQMPAYIRFHEPLRQLLESQAVLRHLDRSSPYLQELLRLVPEAASALGIPSGQRTTGPAGEQRYRLWQGAALVISASVRAAPTLLVLDDLQWGDEGSLALLAFLGRLARRQRLLILGAYREEDVPAGHPLGQAIADLKHDLALIQIRLTGLSKDEVGTLVVALTATDVAGDFIEEVHRRTEGNPLFVEEILRHVLQKRPGESAGSVWDISPADIELSAGIRQVIAGRLSRLSHQCKRMVEAASVLGRNLELPLLEVILEEPTESLLLAVDEAVGASVFRETGPGLFSFAHPIMRSVIYHAITPSERAALHQKVAARLEAHFGAGAALHAEEIARHLLTSGGLADAAKTIDYCRKGAKQAIALFAYGQAAELARGGLAYVDKLPWPAQSIRADLLGDLAGAERGLGHPDEACQLYREALSIYEALGDRDAALVVRGWLAITLLQYGRWPEALLVTAEGLTQVEEERTHAYVDLVVRHALALTITGAAAEAGPWVEKALKLSFDDDTRALANHVAAIWHAWGGGDHERAAEHFLSARRLFLAAGDATAPQAALDHSVSCYFLGKLNDSTNAQVECERLSQDMNYRSGLADLAALRSLAHVHKGEWGQAQEQRRKWRDATRALAGSTAYGQLGIGMWAEVVERFWREGPAVAIESLDLSQIFSQSLRVLLCVETGDQDGARSLLNVLAPAVPQDGRGLLWFMMALPMASAYCSLHDERAAEWYEALARYRGCLAHALMADIELGRISAGQGRWREAELHFEDAADLCEAHELRPFLGQVYYYQALMLLDRRAAGDRRRAESLLHDAHKIFTGLGMAYFQRKVDRLLGYPVRGRPSSARAAGLTEREISLLALLAEGRSNREIAESLFLSEKTVERHLANIYTKIGVPNRAAAAAFALRHGLT